MHTNPLDLNIQLLQLLKQQFLKGRQVLHIYHFYAKWKNIIEHAHVLLL